MILLPRGLYFFGTVRELLDALVRMPDVKLVKYLEVVTSGSHS